MKIINIVGTRPQFVKLAVLSHTIREHGLEEKIIHTGQHFSHFMSDSFFKQLNIPEPDYHLDINSKSHGEMTGQMLIEIEKVLIKENPDYVIVYGDCNTTLAAALAAVKLHISIAHVESGLRSFNKKMPEEINRILVDHTSDLLWVPTKTGLNNLKNEGISEQVILTGDLMLELLDQFMSQINSKKILEKLNLMNESAYFVLTLHRQENTVENRLQHLFNVLSQTDIKIIFPIHPRTQKVLKLYDIQLPKNIHIVESLGYLDMMSLVYHSKLVLTDSGGLQKESVHLCKPTIILREQTEWVENLEKDYVRLISINDLKIQDVENLMSISIEKDLKGVYNKPSEIMINSL